MAINTLNAPDFGSSGAGFIPQLWASDTLKVLRPLLPLVNTIARDSDFEKGFNVGDTLNINYPGVLTAQQKSADTIATLQKPIGAKKIPVVLNQHSYVDVEVEDFLECQAKPDMLRIYTEPAAIALANYIEHQVYTNLVNAQGVAGTAGTNITAATFRTAAEVLDENLAPKMQRKMAVSPKDWYALLGDTTLASYFAFSEPQAVREGASGRLYGFDISESQMLATDAGASTNDVQTITTTGVPTGGTFTLTFGGATTGNLNWNATAAQVQAALVALPSIGAGNVVCTAGPLPTGVVCTFGGNLAGKALSAMTHTDSLTGGSSPVAVVTHTTTGSSSAIAYCRDAFIIAFRAFKPIMPGTGVVSYQMVDPVSKVSLRLTYGYDIANRAMRMGMDILFGTATLRPEMAVRVLS